MLTSKQESFAQAVADGLTQSDAYRQAYDAENMKAEAIWVKASELAANGNVTVRIQELREQVAANVAEQRTWTRLQLLNEATVNVNGAREDRQWSASNGALQLIGKLTGFLVDAQVTHTGTVNVNVTAELTLEQLRDIADQGRRLREAHGIVDASGYLVDANDPQAPGTSSVP